MRLISIFFSKNKGLTLLEVSIVIAIYSLFLIAFYTILDVGLKGWKIGAVRADLQSTSEIIVDRMKGDQENASSLTIEVNEPNGPVPYVCIDTPLYNGDLQLDPNTQAPLWQGHILYYTLYDPSDKDFNTSILYRRYVPHKKTYPYKSNDRLVSTLLYDIDTYVDDTELTLYEIDQGQTLRRISDRISMARFAQDSGIINAELELKENFRKGKNFRISFTSNGSNNTGTERIFINYSITPRN